MMNGMPVPTFDEMASSITQGFAALRTPYMRE